MKNKNDMEEKYSDLIKKIKEFLDGISEDYVCTYLTKEDIRYFYSRFIPELKEDEEDDKIRESIINFLHGGNPFKDIKKETRQKWIGWLEKQVPPKWLYRLEYKDGTCGLWYNGQGEWCFEEGIGSLAGCKTKDLPMDHDERYKQDGRDWFSSCSRKEDLLHWYSLDDAEELIKKGFVFTRYLATEYREYENETVFIKDSSLVREEIDIFELFGKTKMHEAGYEWNEEKKELKKIEQKPTDWSEDDENNINSVVSRLEVDISYWESRSKTRTNEDKKLIDWLKSLKDRILPQPL